MRNSKISLKYEHMLFISISDSIARVTHKFNRAIFECRADHSFTLVNKSIIVFLSQYRVRIVYN